MQSGRIVICSVLGLYDYFNYMANTAVSFSLLVFWSVTALHHQTEAMDC